MCAEKSWKQRNAEAMDMEVSSEDDDGELPAAKKPRGQQANDGSSAVQMQKAGPRNRTPTLVWDAKPDFQPSSISVLEGHINRLGSHQHSNERFHTPSHCGDNAHAQQEQLQHVGGV